MPVARMVVDFASLARRVGVGGWPGVERETCGRAEWLGRETGHNGPGQLAEFTLTTVGIVSLIAGLFVLPTLELNETGFYVGLIALVALMLLSFCAGQLAVIRERLSDTPSPDKFRRSGTG